MDTTSPLKQVVIYTDGGCVGNPGPGGWAAVLSYKKKRREVSGGDPATTNNRMELQAAIGALSLLKVRCQVTLHTDSQYLRKGITEWIYGWKQNGWKTSTKEPVKNEDLWRLLDGLTTRHQIDWRWVKGHAGHAENERCDELAALEINRIRQKYTHRELQEFLRMAQD